MAVGLTKRIHRATLYGMVSSKNTSYDISASETLLNMSDLNVNIEWNIKIKISNNKKFALWIIEYR